MITFMITLMIEYPVSTIKATSESQGVIIINNQMIFSGIEWII